MLLLRHRRQGQPSQTTVGPAGAAATTSRPGGGSQRREYVRAAERLSIEGDPVGRDKNIYLIGGTQRARLRYLSARLSEPVEHAFVEPGGYADLRSKFEKRRAIILRGPAGCGKQGTAIRMLMDLGTAPLFQLDRQVDLTRLAEWIETDLRGRDRIEQGAGFVLLQPASFTSLYGSVLQGLDEVLNRAQARLVITVGSDIPVPDDDLFDYVVELTAPPDFHVITETHLEYRVGAALAGELLAREDIAREVSNHLATRASCKLASDLAEMIAEEADRAGSAPAFDVARITAWKSRRGAEDFDTWFASLGDTRSRSFAIALAVLNGLPYDAVAKAARALYREFESPAYMVMSSPDDPPPEGRRPFLVPRREWLHRLRARVSETEVRGLYGLSYAEAVQYRDPGYVAEVMTRAFADYEAQDTLVNWLGDLTQDGSEQVRIFAAIALGKLTAGSFDYLSCNFLARWAGSDNPSQRDAVAYALRSVIATDPRLAGNVRLMVAGWYSNRDAPSEQATAARAHGVAYGPADPVKAFEALDRMTVINNARVAIAVGDSIADLLVDATDEFTCFVLRNLAESVRDRERSAAAQLVFLILAAPLDKEVPAAEPDGGTVSWPLLLHLMGRLAGARPSIVSLWQHVLNDGLLSDQAEQVMTRWAGAAEGDPQIRQVFLRTARAVAADDQRSGMILSRYAAKWASSDNLLPLPDVSTALQSILTAERGAR
jgi:hypothetical protein